MIHFTVDSLQFSFTKINHDKNQSKPTGKPETQHFGVVFLISASVKSTKPKVPNLSLIWTFKAPTLLLAAWCIEIPGTHTISGSDTKFIQYATFNGLMGLSGVASEFLFVFSFFEISSFQSSSLWVNGILSYIRFDSRHRIRKTHFLKLFLSGTFRKLKLNFSFKERLHFIRHKISNPKRKNWSEACQKKLATIRITIVTYYLRSQV